ncbi:MAG: helix-turn-helix domain-containing protein [Candidatus Binatia bacterium]|jgi:predicted site-specific integrase-resolvase
MKEIPDCLLNEQEAAVKLHVSAKTLQRWRWAGRGPHYVKVGKCVRYDPEDLCAFIDAGRRNSTSDPGAPN